MLFVSNIKDFMVTHVPVPLVLLSNKQVDLFKSNPDAAPIDFLNAARLDFQIHLFQTIRESGLISYFQTVSVVFNPTTRSFTMSVIILILCTKKSPSILLNKCSSNQNRQ